MSSEEKISPEEFDKELDFLLAGTTEKKPKNPKRKKIIIAAAIAILGSKTASPSPAPSPEPTA